MVISSLTGLNLRSGYLILSGEFLFYLTNALANTYVVVTVLPSYFV